MPRSLASLILFTATIATAQQYAPSVPPPPPPPGYLPAPPPSYPTPGPDLPRMLANLSDQPANHTGFTLDRAIARGMLEASGMDATRAAAAITGITFDRYQYQQPAFYTPEAMASLIDTYKAAGWKHMVNGNSTPANTAQPKQMATDLWLHFSGADVDGLVVLMRASREMNVIHLTGDLRPIELLHLSGHFGIPKVDPSAVMVPAP